MDLTYCYTIYQNILHKTAEIFVALKNVGASVKWFQKLSGLSLSEFWWIVAVGDRDCVLFLCGSFFLYQLHDAWKTFIKHIPSMIDGGRLLWNTDPAHNDKGMCRTKDPHNNCPGENSERVQQLATVTAPENQAWPTFYVKAAVMVPRD